MKEAEGSGDKKFPSDDDDHCALLTTTYMTFHLFASFESILYPCACIIVSDMTYILNWHWQHENWTRSCMSKSKKNIVIILNVLD